MSKVNAMSGSPATSIPPVQVPAQIDLLISLRLHLWPALTIAIQNAWGTSSPEVSADKRDWLAGAVSDLFAQNQLRDVEDLEDVLEQVMSDEFEVVVDDGTLEETAQKIWKGVERVKKGDITEVQQLIHEWEKKRDKKVSVIAGQNQEDDDGDDDETSGEDEEWNGFDDGTQRSKVTDVDMDEAPAMIDSSKNKKPEPEVDEDGFTKVVGKKKR